MAVQDTVVHHYTEYIKIKHPTTHFYQQKTLFFCYCGLSSHITFLSCPESPLGIGNDRIILDVLGNREDKFNTIAWIKIKSSFLFCPKHITKKKMFPFYFLLSILQFTYWTPLWKPIPWNLDNSFSGYRHLKLITLSAIRQKAV